MRKKANQTQILSAVYISMTRISFSELADRSSVGPVGPHPRFRIKHRHTKWKVIFETADQVLTLSLVRLFEPAS
jgi:hypothetical protein